MENLQQQMIQLRKTMIERKMKVQAQALIAWGKVESLLKNPSHEMQISDEKIHQAIKNAGGWEQFYQAAPNELSKLAYLFWAYYEKENRHAS